MNINPISFKSNCSNNGYKEQIIVYPNLQYEQNEPDYFVREDSKQVKPKRKLRKGRVAGAAAVTLAVTQLLVSKIGNVIHPKPTKDTPSTAVVETTEAPVTTTEPTEPTEPTEATEASTVTPEKDNTKKPGKDETYMMYAFSNTKDNLEEINENGAPNNLTPEQKEKQYMCKKLDEKLGEGFSSKLFEVCENINCEPEDLVGLMYSESRLEPDSTNHLNATGLVQFMPFVANELGTSPEELKQMKPVEQLDYVEASMMYWRNAYNMPADKKLSGGELYALNFTPGYFYDAVLVEQGTPEYADNAGLDANEDGQITIPELDTRVKNKYHEFMNS